MKLQSRLQTALQILYPPRCVSCDAMVESDFGLCGECWADVPFIGQTVCDSCGTPLPGEQSSEETLVCDSCMRHPPPWRRGRAAVLYQKRARQLVLRLKHGDRHDVVRPAALWMSHAATSFDLHPKTLVVPIPLFWMRMLKRRYNQSALLARAVSQIMDLTYGPDVLQRPKATPSLDGRKREERQSILEDAISVNPKRRSQLVQRPVLLIDDVMTTGATLGTATHACLDAGAQHVDVLVLARVDKET